MITIASLVFSLSILYNAILMTSKHWETDSTISLLEMDHCSPVAFMAMFKLHSVTQKTDSCFLYSLMSLHIFPPHTPSSSVNGD